ncbi:MAG: alpha/beta hydrolase [Dehalococcoidia bacterium]
MHDPALDSTISLRGLAFHYRDYPGAGRPVVLLHGVASSSRIWLLVGPLLGARFRTLALDQRGHGETDKPDSGYDFASVTDDLAAFIDALGLERPVIAGHSWGGNVAVEFAARHPDVAAGLVLVDGGFMEPSARPGATWERTEKELAPPVLTHLKPEELIAMAKQWELGPIWSDEIESALMGNFEVTDEGTIQPRLRREHHMQVVRALWDQKLAELCERVACPVLFAVAERTAEGRQREWMEMKREGVARAQERLADCQVLWFPDTIHDIPLHRPAELSGAIAAFARRLS